MPYSGWARPARRGAGPVRALAHGGNAVLPLTHSGLGERPLADLRRIADARCGIDWAAGRVAVWIPNYAERWRYGERVATSFVESMVNLVVGKRFAKRQQMQ